MSISITCSCGKRLRTADKYAGLKSQCPDCGEGVRFPSPGSDPIPALEDAPTFEFGFSAPIAAPDPVAALDLGITVAGVGEDKDDAPAKAPERVDPRKKVADPCLFRILTAYAFACVGFGFLQFAFLSLAIFFSLDRFRESGSFLVPIGIVSSSFGLLLTILLFVAPILLAVDVARSLRRIDSNAAGRIAALPAE